MLDWLMGLFSFHLVNLPALFFSAYIGATLLPGGTELVILFDLIRSRPEVFELAIVLATLGNTLGGMTSYLIGRFYPLSEKHEAKISPRTKSLIQKYGPFSLFLSWVPLMGDALCLFAGMTRLKVLPVVVIMATGKAIRYILFASGSHLLLNSYLNF